MEPEELLWWERNHIHLSTMISLTDAEPIAELIRQMSLEFYSADSLRDSTLNLYMQILSNKISDLSGTGENGILRPLYDQLVQLRADIYNRPAVQRKIEEEAERLLRSIRVDLQEQECYISFLRGILDYAGLEYPSKDGWRRDYECAN